MKGILGKLDQVIEDAELEWAQMVCNSKEIAIEARLISLTETRVKALLGALEDQFGIVYCHYISDEKNNVVRVVVDLWAKDFKYEKLKVESQG